MSENKTTKKNIYKGRGPRKAISKNDNIKEKVLEIPFSFLYDCFILNSLKK